MLLEILDPTLENGEVLIIGLDGNTYRSEESSIQMQQEMYFTPTIEFTIKVPLHIFQEQ